MKSGALLYLSGHGIALSVKAHCLIISVGETQTEFRPGAHELQCIIADGHGIMVTGGALAWAANERVELLIRGAPDLLSNFVPASRLNRAALNLRSAQMQCLVNRRARLAVAKVLLLRKLKTERTGTVFERSARKARAIDELHHIEAKSSWLWWSQWKGFELMLPATMPGRWRIFSTRYIRRPQGILGELPPQFTPRRAIHPAQSIHNYGIGVLATRMSRVLQAYGYDLGFGFLHDGIKPGRASLVWDAIEEHRVRLAERLFYYLRERSFKAGDFTMRESGEVRIGRTVSMEVAKEAIDAAPISRLVSTANWLGKVLKETARLQGRTTRRRAASKDASKRRREAEKRGATSRPMIDQGAMGNNVSPKE